MISPSNKCPNCNHEMISSGVDMETFEMVCHERDALYDMIKKLKIKIPHGIISDHVLIEAQFKQKEGAKWFGGFMFEFFREFIKLMGRDRNYIIMRETDFNKWMEKINDPS